MNKPFPSTPAPHGQAIGGELVPGLVPGSARVWLGETPPSLNRIAGRGSRHAFGSAKRRWQRDLGMLLLAERVPRGLQRVEASALITFPTRRRRDEGNYRALLEKALGDALVEGRWLPDDTPNHYRFGAVTFAEGSPRTVIELRWEGAS